jgi:polyisoprenoid-binding protein YceI
MFDRPPAVRFLCMVACLALVACAPPPRPDAGAGASPAAPQGRPVAEYRVVASDVVVKVYRDGPLAHLGHNHVISTRAVTGRVELREPLAASSFSLALPLDSLVVDDGARRAVAGPDCPDNLTVEDKEGTRRNLLGPALLDAARFPVLQLDSEAITAAGGGYQVTARVDVLGVPRQVTIPVKLERTGGRLQASGEFVLTHAELGLTPFSAALGALRVREDMEVAFRLVAQEDAS